MEKLPTWCVTNPSPALYDFESLTVIEQTARIYAKMNEMIELFNKLVDDTNDSINTFTESITGNLETYKIAMRQEFQDFIDIVNLKITDIETTVEKQNDTINKSIVYIKNNIGEWTVDTVNEMVRNGQLFIGTEYNEQTKALNIVLSEE